MSLSNFPVTISALHETAGSKVLIELAKPKQGERTQRTFNQWKTTPFGAECEGMVYNNGRSQKVILQIGTETGIHIKDDSRKKGMSFRVGADPHYFTIFVHPDADEKTIKKLANQLAAFVGKGCPLPKEFMNR